MKAMLEFPIHQSVVKECDDFGVGDLEVDLNVICV